MNSPGNPWSQSSRRKKGGCGEKDLQKRKVSAWNAEVMDDKYRYGESMEPMVEVPVIQLGESELERTVRG